MKRSGKNRVLSCVFYAILLVVTSITHAQNPGNRPVFSYPIDPDALIISYSETPQMLGNPDLTPRIQVFGDGRVQIHYPHYMQRAGDYEVYLNPGEMRQLLLAMSGIFDFDSQAVKHARKAVKEHRETLEGVVYYRSEDTLEQFEILLDAYRSDQAAKSEVINQQLKWNNIEADAVAYPELEELQKLKGARNSIRALLERDDLVKVQSATAKASPQ